MMKLTTMLLAIMTTCSPALAWEVGDMNRTINSTNFIVDKGCSGTLISLKHKLVLTNHHCIGNGVRTVVKEITLPSGEVVRKQFEELRDLNVSQRDYKRHRQVGESTYKAKIVARWKESDLALLQIRADLKNTIAAPVFGGDAVERGETIYTVGNPLGLDATVNRGVISSVTRMFRVPWADAEVPFLQIDSGISGGNSGGALFNDHGELIGVPAAGVPNNGHLGLAIPYFQVQEFLSNNCYGELWDDQAATYEDCVEQKESEEAEED